MQWLGPLTAITMALARCLSDAGSTCQVPISLTATPARTHCSLTAGCAPHVAAGRQPLPTNSQLMRATRLGLAAAYWRLGALPAHPCAPSRCSGAAESSLGDVRPHLQVGPSSCGFTLGFGGSKTEQKVKTSFPHSRTCQKRYRTCPPLLGVTTHTKGARRHY